MSTLSELVKSRRESGQGVFGSISGSLRDKIKERFDPRRFLNQTGLLTALFPNLKAFVAKPLNQKATPNISPDSSLNNSILENISADSAISAKNSLVLPAIHRDMNVMRQNIGKLLKLEGIKPRTKADMWFKKSKDREAEYENKFTHKPKQIEKVADDVGKKTSFLKKLLAFGALGLGLSLFSGKANAMIGPGGAGNYTGGGLSFNDLTKEEQDKLLDAQFKQEGNKPGNLAARLNNPGAMKYTGSDWQKKYGATMGDKGFAKFPTLEQGRAAQRHLWSTTYGNMPIEQAVTRWAPDASSSYAAGLYSAIGRPSGSSETGKVTSDYGMRVHPITGQYKMHEGQDIGAKEGTPVTSTKEGRVSRVENSPSYGIFVEVTHGSGYKTRYAHLAQATVSVGQSVTEGQQIGKVGHTGRATGPHLHYELMKDDRKINPNDPNFSKLSPVSPVLSSPTKALGLNETSTDVARNDNLKVRDKDVVIKENNIVMGDARKGSVRNSSTDDNASQFILDRAVA